MDCSVCGVTNEPRSKFCTQCGAFLAGAGLNRAGFHEYTPDHLKDKIFRSRAVVEGERKLVTVLFCDIAGSTPLAAKLGAEAMHGLLSRFFTTVTAEVHDFEGTVNQFLGDGFMALFGAPLAHEDHARRAVAAALAIQRVCHAAVADPGTGKIPLRIGLNTGPVVVGRIGDDLRMDYTAIGDTVNMAARMQQLASPGDILVTSVTHEAIRQHFDCEAHGRHRVKGKGDAVPVFRVRRVRASHVDVAIADTLSSGSAIVGRTRELQTLRDRLAQLRQGQGCVVGVIGEAGVGKSRLLQEGWRGSGAPLRWLVGHAAAFGRNVSYVPFSEALRTHLSIDDREGNEANWRRLEAALSESLGEDSTALLPFAGMLLNMELPAMARGLVERLDPQDVRGQIFIAARRLFEALARSQPTVLELEDWHWADAASAALLLHLLPLTEKEAFLVCFSARPDSDGPFQRLRDALHDDEQHRYIEIALEPLSSDESAQLVDRLLTLENLPATVRTQILDKAEGNPLFIEEVVHSLQASGAIHTTPTGKLHFAADDAAIDLPNSIEALIAARIDRLEADAKQLLRLAAVIGRHFYRRVLKALDEARDELDQRLEQLQRSDFIKPGKLVPELEYVFKHALVHEASYRSILENRRRQLHQQVAEAIESLFADRLNEIAASLSYHYTQAGNQAKAQSYLLRAGDQAARMSSDVEALAHYQEAMQSYARAFGEKWDRAERASLERKIGDALFRLGRHEQASEHLYRALSLLGYDYPRSQSGVRLHILRQLGIHLWHRVRRKGSFKGGSASTGESDDRLSALTSLFWMDFYRDQLRFFLDVLVALNRAESTGKLLAAVEINMALGVALNVMRLHALAARYHQRGFELSRRLNDPVAFAYVNLGLASHEKFVGVWDSSIARLKQSVQLFKSHGKLREYGISAGNLSWMLQWRGCFPLAREVVSELVKVADDAADRQIALYAIERSASLQAERGELPQAAQALESVAKELRAIPDYQIFCVTTGGLARCLLWMGELGRAETVIEEAHLVMRAHRISPEMTVDLRETNGWLTLSLLEKAQPVERASLLNRARKAARVLHRIDGAFAGAVPISNCFDGCVKWLCGKRGLAEQSWQRSIESAKSMGANYSLAITFCEMGRLKKDPLYLRKAIDLFQDFGCSFQTSRTLRYLGEIEGRENPDAGRCHLERALQLHASMSADFERQLTISRLRELQH